MDKHYIIRKYAFRYINMQLRIKLIPQMSSGMLNACVEPT